MHYFLRTLWRGARLWYDQGADALSATVSYYMIFAITPFLLLAITFMSAFYGSVAVSQAFNEWGRVLGTDMLHLLVISVDNLKTLANGYVTPLIGTLFFSSMVIVMFNSFANGFHVLWGVQSSGFVAWYRKSSRSIFFTIISILYLALLLSANAFLSYSDRWLAASVTTVLSIMVFLVFTTALFIIAFGLLPAKAPRFRARLFGGFITSLLLYFVKSFVSLYLVFTPTPGLFGTAGLILVFLIWSYVSAAVVYYGAALAYVRDPLPAPGAVTHINTSV